MKEVSLAKAYDPAEVESKWYKVWEDQGYFHASATTPKTPFTIVIPPPNVTGSLHMGHAMYVVQDVITRWRRMQGYNALWLPGTDHAGIATQLVVERMLMKEEGKSRHDLGREEFTSRVWQWKEKYGSRIIEQLRVLGFSLDWQRCRFTMDEGLSRAVLEAFVRLYEDGLIYRARRLINWCTRCYTALSDLEVEAEETDGKLWHIAYPVVGSTERLVVATTRPETLLGDTAVAVHPEDPRFAHLIGKQLQVPLTDRTIPVVANLAGRDLGGAAKAVEHAVADLGPLPRGVTITLRGQAEQMRLTLLSLREGLLLAALAVVLLLMTNFQSVREPLLVLLTLPATVVGSVVLLWLTGTTLNVQSAMGVIMALGVSVATTVLLLSFARTRRQLGDSRLNAATHAAVGRLRPILMTSLAMIAGMVPMALGQIGRASCRERVSSPV